MLKESNKSKFESYIDSNNVLIISRITFRDCRVHNFFPTNFLEIAVCPGGGGGVLGLMFAGYGPLASQSPYPIIIIVYFLANYRPYLSHFLENVIFAIRI